MRRGPLPLSAHVARRAGGPRLNKGMKAVVYRVGNLHGGGLFLEVMHTTDRPLFPCTFWGKYFHSNVRDMLLSLTLGPKMVRAM